MTKTKLASKVKSGCYEEGRRSPEAGSAQAACEIQTGHVEAEVHSFSWRPSTTCVARSVAANFSTR
jgi:hypothetical protein